MSENVCTGRKALSVGIAALIFLAGWGLFIKNGQAYLTEPIVDSAPASPSVDALVNVFFDDMEAGTNGWNATGFWHRVWNHTGAPAWNISYSGNYSWWYGQDATGNYDNGGRNYGNLTSPEVTVNYYPAFLNFRSYYQTETNLSTPDERRVLISVDGGSFQEIDTISGDIMNTWNNYTYNLTTLMKPAYDYELPWDKKGTVLSATLAQEQDRVISPCVLKENGTYKMWYSGRDSAGTYRIFYATSPDGYAWTKYGVVLDVGGTGEDVRVYCPSVIKDRNVYRMWYGGYNGSVNKIFYATSTDGINWTREGVVLLPGPDTYDSVSVNHPYVIKEDSIYKMWYAGSDGVVLRIAYAESSDGYNWTKYGVVLNPGDSYESKGVTSPSVTKMPDGMYRMWYTAYNADSVGNRYRIKSAYSENGINWTKRDVEIDLGSSADPDGAGFPSVLLDGNEFKMWYTGIDWAGPEKINLAITNITEVPHNISIRFSFDTIDSLNNTYQGWYIDDFCIKEDSPPQVLSTTPPDGGVNILTDENITVVFDRSMNTSVIPQLSQVSGTDPGNWTFLGWFSTYEENDTAMWSHDDWSEGESIRMRISGFSDYSGDYGDPYEWTFNTTLLYGASMSPSSADGLCLPGNTIEYILNITNIGILNDTYNLSASSLWPASIYDENGFQISQIFVPAGGWKNIVVNVSIPSSATENSSDTANVTFVSQNRTSVSGYSLLTTHVPYETPFFDRVESGNIGWTRTSDNLWELGMPTSGPSSAYSGSNCWGTNLDGAYPNYANSKLTSPYIKISGNSSQLRFANWFNIESGWDAGWVEIKEYQNDTWIKISPSEGPSYGSTYSGNGFTGSSGGWKESVFNLSAYAGKMVQIRFVLRSDSIVTYAGWYIDNIYIGPDTPPRVLNVLLNGVKSITAEVGDILNLTATIDDTGTGNFSIGGASWRFSDSTTSYDMSPYDGSFDSPIEDVYANINTTGMLIGTHTIYVDGWDEIPCFNRSHLEIVDLTLVDTRAPTVSNEWPPADSYVNDRTPQISVHIQDFSALNESTIKLYVNGFSVAYSKTAIYNGYNISYQQDTWLSPGDVIHCRIVGEDIYGNRVDWAWNFTINGPVNITLHQGWNLITIPWQNTPTNITGALLGLQWDRAMVYIDGKWYTYDKNRDSKYNLGFPDVDNTIGIWVNCTSGGVINGTNDNPGTTYINLHEGWNLVGYPSAQDSKVSDALLGIPWEYVQTADIYGNIYTLASTDYMIVGKGYWIYVSSSCIWAVNW